MVNVTSCVIRRIAVALFVTCAVTNPAGAQEHKAADAYPVLSIPRNAGTDALLKYKLAVEERKLFKEIDSATANLAADADLSAYHKIAAEIGSRHGLTASQSIAFFTRTTFGVFEP